MNINKDKKKKKKMNDADLVLAVVICFVMIAGMAVSIAYMEKKNDDKYGDYDKED